MTADEQHKALIEAADFFKLTARKMMTDEKGLHAETLIISVARMAGFLMYRTFGFDAASKPGTVMLSAEANTQGPKLMHAMLAALHTLGHQIGEADLDRTYATSRHARCDYRTSCDRLAPFFLRYCELAPLGLHNAAFGAAIATGILVHDCQSVLAVEKGAALAVYGFIEGTKTHPWPSATGVKAAPAAAAAKTTAKPWYKPW